MLEPFRIDDPLRTYLELQRDLTPCSVKAVADFILFNHQRQADRDSEQFPCPLME